jgi:hypothetical protein
MILFFVGIRTDHFLKLKFLFTQSNTACENRRGRPYNTICAFPSVTKITFSAYFLKFWVLFAYHVSKIYFF